LIDKEANQLNAIASLERRLADTVKERDTAIMGQAKLDHHAKTTHDQLKQSQEREDNLQLQYAELIKEQTRLSIALTKKTAELGDLKVSTGCCSTDAGSHLFSLSTDSAQTPGRREFSFEKQAG